MLSGADTGSQPTPGLPVLGRETAETQVQTRGCMQHSHAVDNNELAQHGSVIPKPKTQTLMCCPLCLVVPFVQAMQLLANMS